MNRTMTAAAACLLLASAAFAQDTDADTRFHRAYEQEVVDGKVADAARVYLAMMGDEKVPERLRQESKFRFAVTAVLLGRSDEARAYLAELVRDPRTPETLRARANEYLDVAKGIGVGSELDKKLQGLVFDLAKDKEPTPAAYRDFEVIGKPAVPFLRRLLQHEDLRLRVHAYRILIRMGEPGLAEAWNPKLSANNMYVELELSRYVSERPEERAVLERKLLALDDEELVSVLALQSYLRPQLSAETLRAMAPRKIPPKWLLAWFPTNWTVETDRVRGEWIAGDDAQLSAEATLSYLRSVGNLPEGNISLRSDLFPAIVARLATLPLNWWPSNWNGTKGNETGRVEVAGLIRLCSMVPSETVFDTLASVVDRAVAAPAGDADPLKTGVVDALAIGFERRVANAALPAKYADVLKTWFTEASRRSYDIQQPFRPRLRAAIPRLPRDAAESLAVWAVTTSLQGLQPQYRADAIPVSGPQDVAVALAALRAAEPREQGDVVAGKLGLFSPTDTFQISAEYARAITPALAEIVRLWTASKPGVVPPIGRFVGFMQVLPADEARERFVEVATAVSEMPDAKLRQNALTQSVLGIPPNEQRAAYWTDVVLPALPSVWDRFIAGERSIVLERLLSLLDKQSDAKLRAAIAQFVAAHYEEVPSYAVYLVVQAPDLFPLADWVPRVPDVGDNRAKVPSERADPVVLELTKDASAVKQSVLQFTAVSASATVRAEVFDRLLRSAPLDRLDHVVVYGVRQASPEALEDALDRVMASEKPDLRMVWNLVQALSERHPSDRLYPAVRLLLASKTKGQVLAGIEAARAIGREDLLPALAAVLDSMDVELRQKAKEAIDAIVDLRKLREEARKKAADAPK